PRRRGLHARFPGGAVHARGEGAADLRGHQPDSAVGDRAGTAQVVLTAPSGFASRLCCSPGTGVPGPLPRRCPRRPGPLALFGTRACRTSPTGVLLRALTEDLADRRRSLFGEPALHLSVPAEVRPEIPHAGEPDARTRET